MYVYMNTKFRARREHSRKAPSFPGVCGGCGMPPVQGLSAPREAEFHDTVGFEDLGFRV